MTDKVRRLKLAPPATPKESALAAEVREVVATEIRMAGLVADPRPVLQPPWHDDAEQELAAMLLAGHKTPADFAPLRAEHFFATLYQLIFEAAEAVCARGEVCELGGIGLEMKARGLVGEILPELEQIRDCTPFVSDTRVQRRVSAVIEAAAQRKLIDVMHRCDLAMRTGELDVAGARARLRDFFMKVDE